jgi:LuxR family maltose regulon positive regulatory protein
MPTFSQRIAYTTLARVLIDQGEMGKAYGLLVRLQDDAEIGGRKGDLIEILALQALSFQAKDDTDQAITTLEKALTLAEPEGYVRVFVDEGPAMARLLYEALSRGISPDYIRRLLAAFPDTEPEQTDPTKFPAPESEWVEPLSEREIEVLQLVAEGLTNKEIATRLYLSLNTIKVHTRNINGKLGVKNRMQAAARARALGILPNN